MQDEISVAGSLLLLESHFIGIAERETPGTISAGDIAAAVGTFAFSATRAVSQLSELFIAVNAFAAAA